MHFWMVEYPAPHAMSMLNPVIQCVQWIIGWERYKMLEMIAMKVIV